MAIKKPRDTKKANFLKNILNVMRLLWDMDPVFFIVNGILTIIGGIVPILLSYTFKLVLDSLVKTANGAGIVSAALLGYLAFRYIILTIDDFRTIFLNAFFSIMNTIKTGDYLEYRLSEKISSLDIDHFENSETQNLITRVKQRSVNQVQSYINQLTYLISSLITLGSSCFILISFGWWIPALLIVAIIPRFFIDRTQAKLSWSLWLNRIPRHREMSYLEDILQTKETVREIKLFSAREELLELFKNQQTKLRELNAVPLRRYIRIIPIPIIVEAIVLFFLIYIKLSPTLASLITIGTFTFYTQNIDRVLNSAADVSSRVNNLFERNLYVGDFFEFLNLPKLIKEKIPGHVFEEIKPPAIKVQNVTFEYLPDLPILKKVSFQIKPGEHLAIVGPNGAGKSTLIKLLLRFYDPSSGHITINDFDLKDLKLDHWYKFVGTLFQDFSHYPLTIRDNIKLGNPKLVDTEKMIEAAKKSGAHEFIEKLPQGYEQKLGRRFEDSVELSQGQWQKLALARAFYEEAPVLILDEPTSAIDAEAEAEIFENLNKVYKDKTLIFVSHRFSTVRNADKIIVLKDGEIAEEGTHESLMKQSGIYARMFKKQAKGYME